jgi:cytochrome c peroxidase
MKRSFVTSATLVSVAVLGAIGIGSWRHSSAPKSPAPVPVVAVPMNEPIQPIPLHMDLDEKKVALGERLFHEPQLSHDNTISCASCHNLKTGGVDRMVNSVGARGAFGSINAPTVFNSGFNFKQFWDGRVDNLDGQVDGPTHAPGEMGSNWPEIIGKLSQSPAYVSAFSISYPDGIDSTAIKDAIATFERSLYTPNSRFDQFLRGQTDVLTSEEKEGYRLFKVYGCVSCHQGINIGGNLYQKFGVMLEYLSTDTAFGRKASVTDSHRFKVPSLRNVALTPPYFHDGSAQRLEDAVVIMGRYQLGRNLSPEDIGQIVKFLKSLNGEYKGKPL